MTRLSEMAGAIVIGIQPLDGEGQKNVVEAGAVHVRPSSAARRRPRAGRASARTSASRAVSRDFQLHKPVVTSSTARGRAARLAQPRASANCRRTTSPPKLGFEFVGRARASRYARGPARAMVSASWSASSRYWVVSRTVTPSSDQLRTVPHSCSRLRGSSPVVGSSRNSRSGGHDHADGQVQAPAHASRSKCRPGAAGASQVEVGEQFVDHAAADRRGSVQ